MKCYAKKNVTLHLQAKTVTMLKEAVPMKKCENYQSKIDQNWVNQFCIAELIILMFFFFFTKNQYWKIWLKLNYILSDSNGLYEGNSIKYKVKCDM